MRATSSIAQALASGYRRVLCCSEIEEARRLRAELGDEAITGGERDARVIEGFDAGASPREFLEPRAGSRRRSFGRGGGGGPSVPLDDERDTRGCRSGGLVR